MNFFIGGLNHFSRNFTLARFYYSLQFDQAVKKTLAELSALQFFGL